MQLGRAGSGARLELEYVAGDPIVYCLEVEFSRLLTFCLLFRTFQGEIWLPGTDINFLRTENRAKYLCQNVVISGFG